MQRDEKLSIRIRPKTKERLRKVSEALDLPMSRVVTLLIEEFIAKQTKRVEDASQAG